MTSIPTNWATAPIGDLCDLKNGRAFKPSEWSQSGLPIVRIQNLNNPSASFNHYDGEWAAKNFLEGGELLFAWSGTPGTSFGAHVWRGNRALLNQHIFRVDFDSAVLDKRFFRHAINQKLNELIGVAHGGAGLQHVTKGVFESTKVSLPPRKEQRRIADKLDSVLASVDSVSDRLARVGPLLKRFRQSVLAAGTSGRLTEEWRLKQHDPDPWEHISLDDVAGDFGYGSATKSSKVGDVPVLRMGNLQAGKIDWSNLVFTNDPKEIEKYLLRDGDVLFNRTNSPELVGKSAVYRSGNRQAIFAGYLIRVRCGERLLPDYLHYNLCAPAGREYCWRVKSDGVSQSNINASKLRAFEFELPGRDEQAEIVRRVELLFNYAERLEARLKDTYTAAERLTPAVLAKAFRGELVPQDPNDEPASELLRRLQTVAAPVKAKRQTRALDATTIETGRK